MNQKHEISSISA